MEEIVFQFLKAIVQCSKVTHVTDEHVESPHTSFVFRLFLTHKCKQKYPPMFRVGTPSFVNCNDKLAMENLAKVSESIL